MRSEGEDGAVMDGMDGVGGGGEDSVGGAERGGAPFRSEPFCLGASGGGLARVSNALLVEDGCTMRSEPGVSKVVGK